MGPSRVSGSSVAAVVVTYNRKEPLRACLQAIRTQTLPVQEIIVVDNGGRDGTAAMLDVEFPDVTCLRAPENLGAAGGFAEGLRSALERQHDWLWCFDDDSYPTSSDCLAAQVDYARKCERVGFVRGVMKDPATGNLQGAGPWIGSLLSSQAIEACGLPCSDLFFEFEDTEYWSRMLRHGYRVYGMDDVLVWHRWDRHPSLKTMVRKGVIIPPWRTYYQFRNRIYVYSRTGAWWDLARTLSWMGKWLMLSFVLGPQRWLRIRMILAGLRDGLAGHLGRTVEPSVNAS